MLPTATVGDGIDAPAGGWTFAGSVAENFGAHVSRSVPGYDSAHASIVALSDHFVTPGGTVYDVGCSTGTLLGTLADRHAQRGVSFVGVDAESDMVAVARRRFSGNPAVRIVEADARSFHWEPAELFVAHLTLQFLPVAARPDMLSAIHDALRPGGALLLFEKTLAPTPLLHDVLTQAYTEHKLSQGFAAEEVLSKSRALRSVMRPLTSAQNHAMLRRAGFTDVATIHQNLCFEGVLAVKGAA
ncbi:methyltransferase domain-containing protein [Streptomyces sp. NPDC006132]|uniref:methyltransferase domain-containing protein n=1 Tax=Streptomyces sp. NPDC006132 TaxID=3156732 RepID=UPI0033E65E1D